MSAEVINFFDAHPERRPAPRDHFGLKPNQSPRPSRFAPKISAAARKALDAYIGPCPVDETFARSLENAASLLIPRLAEARRNRDIRAAAALTVIIEQLETLAAERHGAPDGAA